jgi:outer membrane lipoprotein-sorting protein
VNGDTYYTYDALTLQGVAIRRSQKAIAADSPDHRPFGNELENMRRQGGEKVREEEITGFLCDVYQLTSEGGRGIIWVDQKSQLPARVEVYERKNGTTRYKNFFNWRKNMAMEEGFFRPDPAIQFKRFNIDEFLAAQSSGKSPSPVPILYGELLKGPDS